MKRRLFSLFLALLLFFSLPVCAQEKEETRVFQTVYVTAPGEPVYFDSEDFQLLCRQATGHDLESLTFSSLPPQAGTFWYRPEDADKDLQLTPGVELFPYEKPILSQTYFRPSVKLTGSAEIPFVMTSVKKETAEGTMVLYVSPKEEATAQPDLGNVSATAKEGQAVSLEPLFPFRSSAWPEEEVRTNVGDKAVNSVIFSLPLSKEGALWLDYGDPDARKLLPEEVLLPEGSPNFYGLTFVPTQKEGGTVGLRYTVTSDKKKKLTGALSLNFAESKVPSRPSTPSAPPEPSPVPFSDMKGWEWADPAVQLLASRYALRQEPETLLFRPGDQATRMEVLHTLVETAFPNNFDPGIPTFSDLPQDPQYARTAGFAFAQGLALGDGSGRLNPDDPITRQDTLVLLYRALLDLGWELPQAGDLSRFSDEALLAPYAREAAGVLLAAGILQGDDALQLQPQAPITRAEMAVLICRAFPG